MKNKLSKSIILTTILITFSIPCFAASPCDFSVLSDYVKERKEPAASLIVASILDRLIDFALLLDQILEEIEGREIIIYDNPYNKRLMDLMEGVTIAMSSERMLDHYKECLVSTIKKLEPYSLLDEEYNLDFDKMKSDFAFKKALRECINKTQFETLIFEFYLQGLDAEHCHETQLRESLSKFYRSKELKEIQQKIYNAKVKLLESFLADIEAQYSFITILDNLLIQNFTVPSSEDGKGSCVDFDGEQYCLESTGVTAINSFPQLIAYLAQKISFGN